MKKLIFVFLTVVTAAFSGCGSSGSGEGSCGFLFSSVTNGSSGKEAQSFWSCQDNEGSYALALFGDGAGVSDTLGAFTWQETGCGEARAQTSEGTVEASEVNGSRTQGVLTFHLRDADTEIETDNSCFLTELAASNPSPGNPPPSPAEPEVPQGEGTNEEVLPEEEISASVFFIFAHDGQFLGFVNDNRFDPDSICNGFGQYGSKFSQTSIWNDFGPYGGDFGSLSAFNNLSSTPPVLFDEIGPLAYVTTNSVLTPRLDSFYLLALLQGAGCDVER